MDSKPFTVDDLVGRAQLDQNRAQLEGVPVTSSSASSSPALGLDPQREAPPSGGEGLSLTAPASASTFEKDNPCQISQGLSLTNQTPSPTPNPQLPNYPITNLRTNQAQLGQSRAQLGNHYGMEDANVPTEEVSGVLEIMLEGHGFLRPKFMPSDKDVYISSSQIRRFSLRPGDMVSGQARRPKENERYWGLLKVEIVNDLPAENSTVRPDFADLTSIYPNFHLKLETKELADKPAGLSARIIDLIAPIGKGQRGMIVSPPKAGKTTILKDIAHGLTANYPDIHLMAVLIGERPEEVTDVKRSIKGEVAASNFDEPAEQQVRVAEIALERAKRLVEVKRDVVILLDSITRLARAYNLSVPSSGRTLSGGFDPAALYPAKHFLGAARSFEEGGSLTIIGTALIDTGSRMDDLIFEEFKGTGNLEIHLDRNLADRRVFPAINAVRSGTRHEELLFDAETMKRIVTMRRMLDILGEEERTELLIERLLKTKSNKEFLETLGKG